MPADPGPRGVFIDEGLNEVVALQAYPLGKTGQQVLQEIRPRIGDIQPAPFHVVAPSEGGDAPASP